MVRYVTAGATLIRKRYQPKKCFDPSVPSKGMVVMKLHEPATNVRPELQLPLFDIGASGVTWQSLSFAFKHLAILNGTIEGVSPQMLIFLCWAYTQAQLTCPGQEDFTPEVAKQCITGESCLLDQMFKPYLVSVVVTKYRKANSEVQAVSFEHMKLHARRKARTFVTWISRLKKLDPRVLFSCVEMHTDYFLQTNVTMYRCITKWAVSLVSRQFDKRDQKELICLRHQLHLSQKKHRFTVKKWFDDIPILLEHVSKPCWVLSRKDLATWSRASINLCNQPKKPWGANHRYVNRGMSILFDNDDELQARVFAFPAATVMEHIEMGLISVKIMPVLATDVVPDTVRIDMFGFMPSIKKHAITCVATTANQGITWCDLRFAILHGVKKVDIYVDFLEMFSFAGPIADLITIREHYDDSYLNPVFVSASSAWARDPNHAYKLSTANAYSKMTDKAQAVEFLRSQARPFHMIPTPPRGCSFEDFKRYTKMVCNVKAEISEEQQRVLLDEALDTLLNEICSQTIKYRQTAKKRKTVILSIP